MRGVLAFAVALAAVAIVAVATVNPRAELMPPSGGVSTASRTPTAVQPRVVFARAVVLDTVPGGGAVMTSAYESFEVITAGGATQSHPVAGVAVGMPTFNGADRIAYWRRGSIMRSTLALSGPYEIVVMDIGAGKERVLLTLKDERSNGEMLWSADRKSLLVPVRMAPSATSQRQNQLLLIDTDSGAARTLHVSSGDASIGPIFADANVLVGIRGSSYVVLDLTSGATRTEAPIRVSGSFNGESSHIAGNSDGTVVELLRRYESDGGPLWIWNARDPSVDIVKVDKRGISDPIFWPGRTEVVYSSATGLAVVDYRVGVTRALHAPAAVHRVVAVDLGGRFALVMSEFGLRILERVGDELREPPDLWLGVASTLTPLGIVFP